MTIFLDFNGLQINPEQIYRIERVVETVTFTVLVGSVPQGSLQMEDFVFASEAAAIAALDTFVNDARRIPFIMDTLANIAGGVAGHPKSVSDAQRAFGDEAKIKLAESSFAFADALADELDTQIPT